MVKGGLKRHRVHRLRLMVQWATVLVGAVALAMVPVQARSGNRCRGSLGRPVRRRAHHTHSSDHKPGLAKVRLGERLFHDVRLSRGNVFACATCHRLAEGGDDGLALSRGWGQYWLSTLPRFSTPRSAFG